MQPHSLRAGARDGTDTTWREIDADEIFDLHLEIGGFVDAVEQHHNRAHLSMRWGGRWYREMDGVAAVRVEEKREGPGGMPTAEQ